MDAHYLERGTLIALGNIIGLDEPMKSQESLYRIIGIAKLSDCDGKPRFFIQAEAIMGRYSAISLSNGELNDMASSGKIKFYNKS